MNIPLLRSNYELLEQNAPAPAPRTNTPAPTPPAWPNRVAKRLHGATFGNLGKLVQDTWSSIFNVFNGWLFDEFDQFGKDRKNRFGGKSLWGKIKASPGIVKDILQFGVNSAVNKMPLVNWKWNYRNTLWRLAGDTFKTLSYPIARVVKPHKESLSVTLK